MNASLSEDSVAETALSKKNSDGTCRFPKRTHSHFSLYHLDIFLHILAYF